jgi:hypothetical protein
MLENTDDRSKVRAYIMKAVEDHWNLSQTAMLLSKLGFDLRKAFPDFPMIMPEGLKAFLLAWPSVKLVSHPHIPEKVGAVPLSVNLREDTSDMFAPSQQRSAVGPQGVVFESYPRYLPEFWRAFHIPIAGRRFVLLPNTEHPEIRIVEREDGGEEPGGIEILVSDIASVPFAAPMQEKVKANAEKIKSWLARNKLTTEPFLAPFSKREPPARQIIPMHKMEDPVALALSKLDRLEQSRILIPFDIVVKMLVSKE